MSPNLGNIPSAADIVCQVETLRQLRLNPRILEAVRKTGTSCLKTGIALQKLLTDHNFFYNKHTERPTATPAELEAARQTMLKVPTDTISELRQGKTVIIEVLFPNLKNHVFAVEPINGGRDARILHAWEDMHEFREERTMPVETLGEYLKSLVTLDAKLEPQKLQEVQGILWGTDHAEAAMTSKPSIRTVQYKMAVSGKCKDGTRLGPLMKTWKTLKNTLFEHTPHGVKMRVAGGPVFGAAIGFVFGAAGVLVWDLLEGKKVNWSEVGVEGGKSALAGGSAGAADVAVMGVEDIGLSLIRSNVAAGVAAASVFVIWDLVAWKSGKISTVEFRKKQAMGLGGAAGGVLGGFGAGVGGGLAFGPIGAIVGGLIGGIAGGIGGAFAGSALDSALWDASEDAVVESYEFFGWRDVPRNQHPTRSPQAMGKAYGDKLKARPPKIEQKTWETIVLRNITVLINAMYPENKELIELAAEMRAKNSEGLRTVATMLYEEINQAEYS